MNKLSDLITWIAGIIVTIFSAVTFLYTNFQTSSAAQKSEDKISSRLDRIEIKIDSILERGE